MAKIGIFWYYKRHVLGRACDIFDGQENVPGIVDSYYAHVDLWDSIIRFSMLFPELKDMEYDEVPRGRVVYVRKLNKAVVYLGRAVSAEHEIIGIKRFFCLFDVGLEWRMDDHYATDTLRISKLLSDVCG